MHLYVVGSTHKRSYGSSNTFPIYGTELDAKRETTDLGAVSTVHAIQVNYADQDATLMGKVPGRPPN